MAEADQRIEHEEDFADTDSAVGDDAASSTASVTSSVYNYQYENGRRYHAYRSGNYIMPNDEQEQERLDLAHHTQTLLLGGQLYRSELSKPRNILDVGTGTGIWAMDMADTFPDAHVIATDLSGIQPEWTPPNLQFQIDDCESDWNFNRKFDFIHLRSMGGSIADWPKLLKNALDSLEPGGFVEVVDWETWSQTDDGSLPMDSSFQKWLETVNKASESFGKPMNIAPLMKKMVTDAGFAKVQEEALKVPISPWAKDPRLKELGRPMQVLMEQSLEAYSLALFTRVLGWTPEEVTIFLAKVRNDIRNRHHHLYCILHRVWAIKPPA